MPLLSVSWGADHWVLGGGGTSQVNRTRARLGLNGLAVVQPIFSAMGGLKAQVIRLVVSIRNMGSNWGVMHEVAFSAMVWVL